VKETSLNPDRDFFARLTSFSLPLGGASEDLKRRRDDLLEILPWADKAISTFVTVTPSRTNFAVAVCKAIPTFDLVIVDEGHNLKHGFGEGVSARNRVVAQAFGHPSVKPPAFRGYEPRAVRVLFLSATPLENDYVSSGISSTSSASGTSGRDLADPKVDDDAKRALARSFSSVE